MSRLTTVAQEREQIEFAEKAALHFASHPEHSSFGEIKQGEYLALRWGLGNDCVLVLKLDEYFEPVNYQQLIKRVNRLELP